jgi:hypothetical protein
LEAHQLLGVRYNHFNKRKRGKGFLSIAGFPMTSKMEERGILMLRVNHFAAVGYSANADT